MKPAPFDYHRPASVADALDRLAELDDAKVLAGGQSLVPLMNFRLATPAHLVDISRLPELRTVEVADGAVTVGAAVTHSELAAHLAASAACPLLGQALPFVAHAVIRNRGTTCGSLAHADPAGELPAVLAVLDGTVTLASTGGTRTLSAGEFFVGPLQSGCQPDELLVRASFPQLAPTQRSGFVEVARRHGDYALCGVASLVDLAADGSVASARLGLVAVAPVPQVLDASEVTAGCRPDEIDATAVYDLVTAAVRPRGDIHASAEYRRHLAGVLAGRALVAAARSGDA